MVVPTRPRGAFCGHADWGLMKPEAFQLIEGVFVAAGGLFAVGLVALGLRMFRADKADARINGQLVGPLRNALKGQVRPVTHGTRDYRIKTGIAVDLSKNEWVEQGRLSDEAVDQTYHR